MELVLIASFGTPVRQLWPFRDRCAHTDSPKRSAVMWRSRSIAINVVREHLRKEIAQVEVQSKLNRHQLQDICPFAPIRTHNSPSHLDIQSYLGDFKETAWIPHSSPSRTPKTRLSIITFYPGRFKEIAKVRLNGTMSRTSPRIGYPGAYQKRWEP